VHGKDKGKAEHHLQGLVEREAQGESLWVAQRLLVQASALHPPQHT
jgi:hypothetical protein